ncbi:phage portal protein [Streptomyces sp. WAC05292]|uniref:phage portal protein n=1 Tax=Streptomyces sp. WAC05292 TaxID=2487418 RepID=UPI000F748B99|nr:phage portal protein [Streptomyces sp. WAC05292]RSS97239.1 phage portal protein [Streptomyces sp. WAC05292]
MARRRWLPALRSLVTSTRQDTEAKQITWTGGYTSTSYAGTSNIWSTEGRADGWDVGRVVTEGYERVVWVYKAIDTMGKHASRLPLEVGVGLTEDGEFEQVIEDHPLLRVLNGRANPVETGAQFRKRLSAQILLSKRGAFVEVTRSNRGTITRLDLLPPDRVMPVPDPRGEYIAHYEFTTLHGEVRELDPERVRWIRDPHPTDPFSGVTPLEAAGISVELDHLSRLYNVAFIKNDARPGGIVAVDTSSLSDKEMDRLEARFLPGSEFAGHVSVVGSGPGGMNYVDLAARPREMAYEAAAQNAKIEILGAFGVPESVTGNAAGRTFDNAEQEEYGFWVHTELPHLELISNAFASDLGGLDRAIRFDTSTVEALELPRRKRRAEAREEWNAGLISADEYRRRAGLPAFDNAHTRALWISPQKAPVPARPEDAAALGIAGAGGPGQLPPGQAPADPNAPLPPATDASGDAAAAVAQARAESGQAAGGPGAAAAAVGAARSGASAEGQAGAATAAVQAARETEDQVPGDAAAAVAQALGVEVKALPGTSFEVTEQDFDRGQEAVAAALAPLFDRQEGVILARLRSPKSRKGTKFWKADGASDTRGGAGPLDIARVIGTDRWLEEIDSTVARVLAGVARTTAERTAAAFGAPEPPLQASGPIVALVLDAVAAAEQTAHAFLDTLATLLNQAQESTDDVEDLVALVRTAFTDMAPRTAASIAESAAVATVNGAADATATSLGPAIVRTWVTRRDDRVRAAHSAVDGTTLPVGDPFTVDGYAMRWPGDQLAPLHLTINCRCRLRYRPDGGEL